MTAPTAAAASVPVTISGTTPVPVTDGHNAPVGMTLLNRGDNGGTVLVQPGPAGQAAAVPLGPAGSLTWTDPANVPYVSLRVPGAAPETVLLTSQSAAYSNPTVVAAATAASLAASGIPQLFTSTAVYSATLAPGAASPTLDVSNFASVNLFASFPASVPTYDTETFDGIADGSPWPAPWTGGALYTTAGCSAVVKGNAGALVCPSPSGTSYTATVGLAGVTSLGWDVTADLTRTGVYANTDTLNVHLRDSAGAFTGYRYTVALVMGNGGTAVTINLQHTLNSTITTLTTGTVAAWPMGATRRLRVTLTTAGVLSAFLWDPAAGGQPAAPSATVNDAAGSASVPAQGMQFQLNAPFASGYVAAPAEVRIDNLTVTGGTQLNVGTVRATFTDPALTAAPTGGPWQAIDPNWAPTESCFAALPVLAPKLILTNTGKSPAAVTVAGTTRSVAGVRQNGDEVGIRQLSVATVAAGATVQLTSAAGSSLTRMNGHVVVTAGNAAGGTLYASYVDEGGNTITQTITTTLGSTAPGAYDFMHPSVPVRWTYKNTGSSAQAAVPVTVAAVAG